MAFGGGCYDAPSMAELIAALLLSTSLAAAPNYEMRGLWVVRTGLLSPASVDRVVDEAQAAGFNALFVQVRGRGDAFYESHLVPRSVLLERQPRTFDPLARLMERARARGLEVHAWVNVLLSAHFGMPLPEGHVLARHPDWVMVPRSVARAALRASPRERFRLIASTRGEGDVEGYYLSPSVPGVGEYLDRVVRELVHGYAVDGIHLDFMRYPGPDYDHSRPALEGFRRLRERRDLLEAPGREAEAWSTYRRDVLTGLADRLSRAARAERPGILVSAAVVPDEAEAVHHKFQSWPAWAERGLLDAICPMAYTPDDRIFRRQIEMARDRLGGRQPVWAGVGAYRLPLEATIDRIRAARASGAAGVVVFSHESFAASDLKRLRVEAFPPPVAAKGTAPTVGAETNPR
jgi:uncharacterized lipoprotein YddW (UPF0748 family)